MGGLRRAAVHPSLIELRALAALDRVSRLPAQAPYFRAMPPRRRPTKDTPAQLAARMRSWRVSLLRGRAQPLGTVEAPDERTAQAAGGAGGVTGRMV